MKYFVVTTGKGDVWVTYAGTNGRASSKFTKLFPGASIASIIEAQSF